MRASTAWSRSASGMMTMWFFAPPSACTRLPEACRSCRCAPRSGWSRRTRSPGRAGCSSSASTASLSPWTTLNTPSGSPASFRSCASSTLELGSRSRGLHDERIAAGDGDREHPHRHHGGKVERRDAGARRRAAGGTRATSTLRADVFGELAFQQLRDAAGEFHDFQTADDFALGVGKHLAVLGRDDGGEPVHVALDELAELNITRARRSGGVPAQAG